MPSNEPNDDVAIFWDFENCSAPASTSGYFLVNQIRSIAHNYGIPKLFKAYVEIEQIKAPMLRAELQSSGVSLTDCPHMGRKDVVDKMMIVDMMAYAMDHPGPRTIMIISGDRDYAYAAAILRLRRYHVVVISSSGSSSISNCLTAQASVCYDWSTDVLGKVGSQDNTSKCSKDGDAWRSSSLLPKLPTPSPEPVRPTLSGAGRSRRNTISRAESTSKLAEEIQGPMYIGSTSTTQPPPSRTHSTDSVSFAPVRDPPVRERASTPIFTPLNGVYTDEVIYDAPHPVNSSTIPPTPAFPTSLLHTPSASTSQFRPDEASPPATVNVPPSSSKPVASLKGKEKEEPSTHPPFTSNPVTTPQPPAAPTILATSASAHISQPSRSTQPQPLVTPPRAPPAEYISLVKVLEAHRKAGRTRPNRSIVACEIISADKSIYTRVGVAKFSQYISLAESKKIVSTGGENGSAWISLLPEWYNSV